MVATIDDGRLGTQTGRQSQSGIHVPVSLLNVYATNFPHWTGKIYPNVKSLTYTCTRMYMYSYVFNFIQHSPWYTITSNTS